MKHFVVEYTLNEGKRVIEGVFNIKSWREHLNKQNAQRDKEDKLKNKDFEFTDIKIY